MSSLSRIPIDVPGCPTALVVGRGALGRLAEILADGDIPLRGRKVLLAVDARVSEYGRRIDAELRGAGASTVVEHLVASEADKSIAAVERLWQAALAHRLDRGGLFVAVGGGIVGDLAGFAAASFLRGVELVQVPTTLLAMVDAAIGGKTGINLPLPGGGLGKNLAGAFWQPRLTVADPDVLETLPARELRAGLAECIKHAVIAGSPHFESLESFIDRLSAGDAEALAQLVPDSASVKAGIVARDPLERGERALLNLGHTFGHAIETLPGLDILHGEAVAIGMVAACRCAVAVGSLPTEVADRIERLIARAGLPTRIPAGASCPDPSAEIRRRMGFDKKVRGATLRLILPYAIGDVRVVAVPVAEAIASAGAGGDRHSTHDAGAVREDSVHAGIAAIAPDR